MKVVDTAAMRDIDLRAQEEFGIPELLLMESAGREAANVILQTLPTPTQRVAVFCGKGNNGGDGFVVARYLLLNETPVTLFFLGEQSHLKTSARVNYEILERFHCPIIPVREDRIRVAVSEEGPFQLAVDALLGIGVQGEVREPYRTGIKILNELPCPVIAIDIPSGLCADTGKPLGDCVEADKTVTFGLPKKGFFQKEGGHWVGELIVRNIGYPKVLLS